MFRNSGFVLVSNTVYFNSDSSGTPKMCEPGENEGGVIVKKDMRQHFCRMLTVLKKRAIYKYILKLILWNLYLFCQFY